MENITEDVLRFKEAVRHVWNAYLVESDSTTSPELQVSFEKIERELLRALVLLPSGIPAMADNYRVAPMPIRLQARAGISDVPVQFGSFDANKNMRWELPVAIPAVDLSQYLFIEFFDWNPYGRIDLSYVKASSSDGRPSLIEQMYCDFVIDAGQ